MGTTAITRPAEFVAPRGAQIVGLVFDALNAFVARRRQASEARRASRIALDAQRHREELSGCDISALPARLAGLNR